VQGHLTEFEKRWTDGYIFENEWRSFRTRKDRKVEVIIRVTHLFRDGLLHGSR
jgi:hypothetical protein